MGSAVRVELSRDRIVLQQGIHSLVEPRKLVIGDRLAILRRTRAPHCQSAQGLEVRPLQVAPQAADGRLASRVITFLHSLDFAEDRLCQPLDQFGGRENVGIGGNPHSAVVKALQSR